jgi:hypothetical protein
VRHEGSKGGGFPDFGLNSGVSAPAPHCSTGRTMTQKGRATAKGHRRGWTGARKG